MVCSIFTADLHITFWFSTQGRNYDGHILDMFEFGVENFQSLASFHGASKGLGSKPLINFIGDQWDLDSTYSNIQSILLDLFRGDKPEKLSTQGLDHVISFSIVDNKIYVRAYTTTFAKEDSKVSYSFVFDLASYFCSTNQYIANHRATA